MDFNWLTPKAVPGDAGKKGKGSWVIEPINRGETVAVFGGYAVSGSQLADFSADRVSRAIQVDDDMFLMSGERPEPGDFLNHSCDPNCGILGSVVLRAMRDIEVGEELTFDYAMCDSAPYDGFVCHCETERCRGQIDHQDWRREDLQRRYAGYFSSYLTAKFSPSFAG